MSRCFKASRFSPWPPSTSSPPPKRSKKLKSILSRCRSSSIRWSACGPAARTPERTATSGCACRPLRRSPGNGPPVTPPELHTLKWTEEDFAEAKQGRLPMGKATDEWTSAMSTRDSRTRRWFWTKRSSRPTPATSASKLAPRWPTGRTARSTFTPARRAPRRPSRRSRDGWASTQATSFSSASIPAADLAAR